MNIPARLIIMVKHFEGFHRVVRKQEPVTAVPYLCPAGYWTIGYGVLCDRGHPPITLTEGEAMLARIMPAYVAHAVRLSPRLATAPEDHLSAIADFIFNLGPTRYAGSTLRRVYNAGDLVVS